jgi:hypothetical protein
MKINPDKLSELQNPENIEAQSNQMTILQKEV